jgi:hypothetical protein
VNPGNVRVTTEFRVYRADQTPSELADDTAVRLGNYNLADNIGGSGDEYEKVRVFGSCVFATDEWTDSAGLPIPDTNGDLVPDTTGGETRNFAGGADFQDENCASNVGKWRTIAEIPANSPKGRYRVNVRTISTPHSAQRSLRVTHS